MVFKKLKKFLIFNLKVENEESLKKSIEKLFRIAKCAKLKLLYVLINLKQMNFN
jgi:hypothetical protein